MAEFRILGPLEVVERDRGLALGGRQQRAVLAVLVLHRGELVSTERVIDELWGERAPASAAKTVQGYVSHLRKVLGGGVIVTEGRGYRLAVALNDLQRSQDPKLSHARSRPTANATTLREARTALTRGVLPISNRLQPPPHRPGRSSAYQPGRTGAIGNPKEEWT